MKLWKSRRMGSSRNRTDGNKFNFTDGNSLFHGHWSVGVRWAWNKSNAKARTSLAARARREGKGRMEMKQFATTDVNNRAFDPAVSFHSESAIYRRMALSQ